MGILLWVGFLFAAFVFFGVVWLFCRTVLWILGLASSASRPMVGAGSNRNIRPAPRPVAPPRNVPPAPQPASLKPPAPEATPDIMPKWNAAHRRYVDRAMADWQEQFDALNRRRL